METEHLRYHFKEIKPLSMYHVQVKKEKGREKNDKIAMGDESNT